MKTTFVIMVKCTLVLHLPLNSVNFYMNLDRNFLVDYSIVTHHRRYYNENLDYFYTNLDYSYKNLAHITLTHLDLVHLNPLISLDHII